METSVTKKTGGKKSVWWSAMNKEFLDGFYDGSILLNGKTLSEDDIEEIMNFSYEKYWVSSNAAKEEYQGFKKDYFDHGGGAPPLRHAVQDGQPLNDRVTGDSVSRLLNKARGSNFKTVLESDPGLTKLSVPGYIRLGVEGTRCDDLKVFKSASTPGINLLSIGGLPDVTKEHFQDLQFLLVADNHKQHNAHKARLYRGRHLPFDDDSAIDIETCPICQKLGLESCQGKYLCSACSFCIGHCVECARDYDQSFGLDYCWDCWDQLWKYQEKQEGMHVITRGHTDDIVDLLPSDSFGMETSATFTKTGWIEEIEKDFGLDTLGFGMDENEVKTEDDLLFAGLNFVWKDAMGFNPGVGNRKTDRKSVGSTTDKEFLDGLYDGSILLDGNKDN